MGVFDHITCKYPLPVEGANALSYQTKDTPALFMDRYEIREDGTLWHEEYDIEDHSDRAKWIAANPGKEIPAELDNAISSFGGSMSRVNNRWEPVKFAGEIYLSGKLGERWLGWSAYFVDGRLNQIHLLEQ